MRSADFFPTRLGKDLHDATSDWDHRSFIIRSIYQERIIFISVRSTKTIMFITVARPVGRPLMNRQALLCQRVARTTTTPLAITRLFSLSHPPTDSSSSSSSTVPQDFDPPKPPEKLNNEMAKGIVDTTQFYIRHGVAHQHLKSLSQNVDMPVVTKWQKMMQIFLMTQLHVISGLGYSADEQGLAKYAQDLAAFVQKETDPDMSAQLVETRTQTWREIVATCFGIEKNDIPVLSVVDARNLMHKVSSKMMEPDVLMKIQKEASIIESELFVDVMLLLFAVFVCFEKVYQQ